MSLKNMKTHITFQNTLSGGGGEVGFHVFHEEMSATAATPPSAFVFFFLEEQVTFIVEVV